MIHVTPSEPSYEDLDPNIRDVVRFCRDLGFETTDSGDGQSKPTDDEWDAGARHPQGVRVLDYPHVFIVCDPNHVAGQSARLMESLRLRGVDVQPVGPEGGVHIQATFDPACIVPAIIELSGLTDDMLRAAKAKPATRWGVYEDRDEGGDLVHQDIAPCDEEGRTLHLTGRDAKCWCRPRTRKESMCLVTTHFDRSGVHECGGGDA